ncbi:hypothetical protein [Streptomyces sp. SM12]|uniref:hypothetical protein n=1 Tax=Streptomyces sp. SM12 TaxID=1071602 RepID=UPI000CD54830|nr:hypothetical protein [Streptomyces sp. SM12]
MSDDLAQQRQRLATQQRYLDAREGQQQRAERLRTAEAARRAALLDVCAAVEDGRATGVVYGRGKSLSARDAEELSGVSTSTLARLDLSNHLTDRALAAGSLVEKDVSDLLHQRYPELAGLYEALRVISADERSRRGEEESLEEMLRGESDNPPAWWAVWEAYWERVRQIAVAGAPLTAGQTVTVPDGRLGVVDSVLPRPVGDRVDVQIITDGDEHCAVERFDAVELRAR